jgi:hypothetical protein
MTALQQTLKYITVVSLHKVDLFQTECHLLLSLEHFLFELLQCQSTCLSTGFRCIVKQFLKFELSGFFLTERSTSLDHGIYCKFLVEFHILEVMAEFLYLVCKLAVVVKSHREVLEVSLVLILVRKSLKDLGHLIFIAGI